MTSIISEKLNEILSAHYLSTYSLFFIYQINLRVDWHANDKFHMETDKKCFLLSEFHTVKTHLQEPRIFEVILNRLVSYILGYFFTIQAD